MKWIKCFGPLVLMTFALSMASCQGDERTKGWNADLDYYIQAVKKDHYVYRAIDLPPSFNRLAEELRKNISSHSDQRMLIEFERLAAQLGDGHTYILPWAAGNVATQAIPLRFYLFSDGLFIIDAFDPAHKNLIGCRVDKLGSVTAAEAMKKIGEYVSRDNEVGKIWIGPVFLMLRSAWEVLGLEEEQALLTLTDRSGATRQHRIPFGGMPRLRGVPKLFASRISDNPIPLYLANVESNFWIKTIPAQEKTLYVQFNQVWDEPNETLSSFAARLGDSLRAQPTHLIIDVRHNNGGNAMLLDPLLNEMKSFRALQGRRITIITGRNTFSACQIFISRADALVHPTFAGERSSSKPNFVGEEYEVVLPYSGARGSISNRYHESIPGDTRQWIEVNIPVVLKSTDYFANQDPILAKVLAAR